MRPLSSSPNKSNTWTMCSLPLVSGVVARLCTSVHGCVSVVHGVHVCPECRVLRQSPTHSANVRTLRKTLAENRRQGQRHSGHTCTPCTTETQPCTLVHNRATTPDTSGREHIVHVLLLLGEEESGRILLYRGIYITNYIMYCTILCPQFYVFCKLLALR